MQVWRKLGQKAPWFLLGCTIVATLLIAAAVWLTATEMIGGAELALCVFVAALFAISPSVLLLLERPLAGLDNFSPGIGNGSKSDDSDAEAGAAAKPGNAEATKQPGAGA